MAWLYLLLASVCEMTWASGMKVCADEGFSKRPWLALGILVTGFISFVLLALAMRTLPMGTSYAVWTGLGAAGTAVVGILLFHEPAAAGRILCIALIIAGIVGLRLTSP